MGFELDHRNVQKVMITGSAGTIGLAMTKLVQQQYPKAEIHTLSRKTALIEGTVHHQVPDYDDISLNELSRDELKGLDLVFVANGLLHDGDLQPEKSLKNLSSSNFETIFKANTIAPMLLAQYFLPLMSKHRPSVFAALSARVGSISDNGIGGWYSYRASKAALNMMIKTAAIEFKRKNKQGIIVGLHPGTVDSNLSKPFQANVPEHKLFSPEQSAAYLLKVIQDLTPENTGRCYAWDGQEIQP